MERKERSQHSAVQLKCRPRRSPEGRGREPLSQQTPAGSVSEAIYVFTGTHPRASGVSVSGGVVLAKLIRLEEIFQSPFFKNEKYCC